MNWESFRNNPLLAALLATLAAGLGHLYLRRWLRAVGWLAVTLIASALFIPGSTLSAVGPVTLGQSLSILPVVFISAASALDAFVIAKIKTRTGRKQAANTTGPRSDDESPVCPACRKPVDPDLQFCHWCTTEFEAGDVTELKQSEESRSNGR